MLISKVAEFMSTYKKRGRRSRKNSGNNLLGSRRSRKVNEEDGSDSEEDQ